MIRVYMFLHIFDKRSKYNHPFSYLKKSIKNKIKKKKTKNKKTTVLKYK